VDRESLRQPVRLDYVRATHQRLCARHQLVPLVRLSVARGLALTRRETTQLFDRLEQLFARLLLENRAQQTTERAHVAPERRFLRLALARRQLVQTLALIFDLPQTLVFVAAGASDSKRIWPLTPLMSMGAPPRPRRARMFEKFSRSCIVTFGTFRERPPLLPFTSMSASMFSLNRTSMLPLTPLMSIPCAPSCATPIRTLPLTPLISEWPNDCATSTRPLTPSTATEPSTSPTLTGPFPPFVTSSTRRGSTSVNSCLTCPPPPHSQCQKPRAPLFSP